MINESAVKTGRYIGKKLLEASKTTSTQKQERFLYPASLALEGTKKQIGRIPDEIDRLLTWRDVNLGIDLEIASDGSKEYQKASKIRALYQKLLRKLDL